MFRVFCPSTFLQKASLRDHTVNLNRDQQLQAGIKDRCRWGRVLLKETLPLFLRFSIDFSLCFQSCYYIRCKAREEDISSTASRYKPGLQLIKPDKDDWMCQLRALAGTGWYCCVNIGSISPYCRHCPWLTHPLIVPGLFGVLDEMWIKLALQGTGHSVAFR